jgi:hypothetical protein
VQKINPNCTPVKVRVRGTLKDLEDLRRLKGPFGYEEVSVVATEKVTHRAHKIISTHIKHTEDDDA